MGARCKTTVRGLRRKWMWGRVIRLHWVKAEVEDGGLEKDDRQTKGGRMTYEEQSTGLTKRRRSDVTRKIELIERFTER